MKSFKDVLYDKNDILVAIIILIIAAAVIFFRINAIMDYPSTLVDSEETGTTQIYEETV